MATTTNFGWETPDDTDLVKDGALAMRTLGNAIDASLVDLKGGTTGQVLSKASNTDLDYTWVTQDDANAIQNAIVDAKGDLIAASAADTPARLAVGNNGETLVADSSTSTGLKWGVPKARAVAVYPSANISLANNTLTTINFDSEFVDSDAFHSTSSNTSRITIPTGLKGVYQINVNMSFAGNSNGIRDLYVWKNATSYYTYQTQSANANGDGISASFILPLDVGDYIEVRAYQNSGGNLNILAPYTSFSAAFLGYY